MQFLRAIARCVQMTQAKIIIPSAFLDNSEIIDNNRNKMKANRYIKAKAKKPHNKVIMRMFKKRHRWLATQGKRFGCTICAAAGLNSSWARTAAKQKRVQGKCFKIHEKSFAHRRAVAELAGTSVEAMDLESVPSASCFKRVLEATRQGRGLSNDIEDMPDVGKRNKKRKLLWCLAVARAISKTQT